MKSKKGVKRPDDWLATLPEFAPKHDIVGTTGFVCSIDLHEGLLLTVDEKGARITKLEDQSLV